MKICISADAITDAQLKQLAKAEGTSVSNYIRMISNKLWYLKFQQGASHDKQSA